MKARMGERTVDVWKVAHETTYETWVQHLFDAQICFWNPRNLQQLRFNMMFGGAALVGDYLVQMGPSDLKVISEKRFRKEFTVLSDDEQ
jgi:hypothetical protein